MTLLNVFRNDLLMLYSKTWLKSISQRSAFFPPPSLGNPKQRSFTSFKSSTIFLNAILSKTNSRRSTKYFFGERNRILYEKQVCQDRHLDHWVLYLADWGYNTEEERFQAQQNPRIQILSLNTFASLLKRPSKTTQ